MISSGLITLGIGLALGAIYFPLKGDESQGNRMTWEDILNRGGTRDRTVFFTIPGFSGMFISFGLLVLSADFNLGFIPLATLTLALLAFTFGTFAWGLLGVPYPLALTPSWFRPIKAKQIRKDKRKREEWKARKRRAKELQRDQRNS